LLENTLFIFTSDNGGDIPPDETRPEQQAMAAGLNLNGNTRGDKHMIYEGGIRVPFIVSWPGKVQPNQRTQAFVTTADIFSTLSEVVTGKVPDASVAAPDSFSFAKVLKDPTSDSTRPHGVFRDAQGRKAVRFGDWKYVDNHFPQSTKKKAPIELYNLSTDPLEEHNLADSNPEVVQTGQRMLQKIQSEPSSRQVSFK